MVFQHSSKKAGLAIGEQSAWPGGLGWISKRSNAEADI
jgi:hypothetical protein